ncbi:macro domain-containing protein [Actinomadura atramentaria]|uniref:macro domain-containing protein n=1 Tax=Actinomadura atramentaria TaxID=1990 RepID=UPI0003790E35|nr:macro domain-containing protein [Actinomadura atramentaria]
MGGIRFLRGDATVPQAKGVKLIAHVCNDRGGWGKGFVLALSARWPEPEKEYRAWHRGRPGSGFRLGAVQVVRVDRYVHVANMVAQHGTRTGSKGPPIRYDALDECLAEVGARALDLRATVHMPRIGCGLAGGDWRRVEPMVQQNLVDRGVEVTVYDHD